MRSFRLRRHTEDLFKPENRVLRTASNLDLRRLRQPMFPLIQQLDEPVREINVKVAEYSTGTLKVPLK